MRKTTFGLTCAVLGAALAGAPAWSASSSGSQTDPQRKQAQAQKKPAEPQSSKNKQVHKKQVGKASIYAPKFTNRKMANGERMDPNADNAASRTLPLGTRARVTNLETGKSAVVTIEDRGPYVDGRIVDLSPATAGQIGLTMEQGLAQVEVTPLSVPPQ
jgi:rare lipoprotein A